MKKPANPSFTIFQIIIITFGLIGWSILLFILFAAFIAAFYDCFSEFTLAACGLSSGVRRGRSLVGLLIVFASPSLCCVGFVAWVTIGATSYSTQWKGRKPSSKKR